MNKDLADFFQANVDSFNDLERYLREQGFNSLGKSLMLYMRETLNSFALALNIQSEIIRLIGTGVILFWLALQMQRSQGNTSQFLFNIEQIRVRCPCFNLYNRHDSSLALS